MDNPNQIPPLAIAILAETYPGEPIPLAVVSEFVDIDNYRDFELWLAYAICQGEMIGFDHEDGYRFRATMVTNLVQNGYPIMMIYSGAVDWHNLLAYWMFLEFTETEEE